MHRSRSAAARIALALVLVMAAVLAGCGGMVPAGFSGDVDVLLTRGTAFEEFTARQPGGSLADEDVVALGYLERARLGLGSPFRLIHFALRDPLLSPNRREAVAYAVLARVLRDEAYQIDPAILEYVRLSRTQPRYEVGAQQLHLIEQTVEAAPTAESGERAVRLGYRLAQAEKTVVSAPFSAVAHAAAMVADRRRAREDAAALLRAAVQRGVDPLELLAEWRRELRFQVEGPVLDPPSVREEEWEAREGPRVALALRTLAHRAGARGTRVYNEAASDVWQSRSLLSAAAAERLAALAAERDYPAQAPIAVAVSINREAFLASPSLADEERESRRRFVERSWSEERLVAEAHRLRAGHGTGRRLSLILLQASTFFRVWNQEEPWFPGDPAPAARDVAARFGLERIEFDGSVPAGWRPFYVRMLAQGLGDLQRVLPAASVRGLTIRFGPLPEGVSALALHEPRTRTLVLPPHTGSGTLAHEIAHDLDWQLARKRYGQRGGYATDLAVRRGPGDRIAASLTGLAASLVPPVADSVPRAHDTRPAEVFARGSDWLVAVLLAQQGRTGGYLTSYQDAALTGYGTTRGPDIGGGVVPNLLAILDAIAPVPDAARLWTVDQFGPNRTLSPMETTRAILRIPAQPSWELRMDAIASARDRSLSSLNGVACRFSSAQGLRRLVTAQRALIEAGTAAALRGAAVEAIHSLAEQSPQPLRPGAVDAWLARRLFGAPEPVDSLVEALSPVFEDVLIRAEVAARQDRGNLPSPFSSAAVAPICGSNPFAVPSPPLPRRVGSTTARAGGHGAIAAMARAPDRVLPVTPWHASP